MDLSMSKLCIIAYIATITSSSSTERTIAGVTIDDQLNRALLDKHNELRDDLALNGLADTSYDSGDANQPSDLSQPKATFMNELHFDEGLAALAQNYLDGVTTCGLPGHNGNRKSQFLATYGAESVFEYDSSDPSYIGENILVVTRDSSDFYTQAATQAQSGWCDEYKWYHYDTSECYPPTGESCGHYTEMVDAEVRYMGCGYEIIDCGDGTSDLIVLCNYYPGGNTNLATNKPYPKAATSSDVCSTCSTDAPDRTACDGTSSGLCSGCQATNGAICNRNEAGNCATLSCPTISCPGGYTISGNTASCSVSWVPETCVDQGLNGNYDELLNGHLCKKCRKKCGTCTTTEETSPTCQYTGDNLAYTFPSSAQAQDESKSQGFVFDEEDNTIIVTQNVDWYIAGMCMIAAVCCIILGIGYYLHYRKVEKLTTELKAQKLISNEAPETPNNVITSEHSETIDVTINGDDNGEPIEVEAVAVIDETAQ